jgi:hypothetical protein
MAAIRYLQVDDQSSVFPKCALATTPAQMRTGHWYVHYVPMQASGSSPTTITLASVDYGGGIALFTLEKSGGTYSVKVTIGGTEYASAGGAITWAALQNATNGGIQIYFNAVTGQIQVTGASAGNGTFTTYPWTVSDGELLLGVGHDGAGGIENPVDGYVSAPFPGQGDVGSNAWDDAEIVTFASVFDYGSDPDVQKANNLITAGGDYSPDNIAVSAAQPHAVVRSAGAAFDCDGSDDILYVEEATPVASIGDLASLWVVAKFDQASPPNDCPIDVGASSTTNTGLTIFVSGTTLYGRARCATSGQTDATTTHPGTGVHLFRVSLRADGVAIAVDGSETVNSVTTGGFNFDVDSFSLAASLGGTRFFEGDIYASAFKVEPSEDEIAAIDADLAGRFGISI